MLGALKILALSPELGISDANSATFFIESAQTLKQVLSQNYKWLEFTAKSMRPRIKIVHLSTYSNTTTGLTKVSLSIENTGFPDYTDYRVLLDYNQDYFANFYIESNLDHRIVWSRKDNNHEKAEIYLKLV